MNVSPNFVYDSIQEKIKKVGVKPLPMVTINGSGESTKIQLNPSLLTESQMRDKVKEISEEFTDGKDVVVKYKKVVAPYFNYNEAGITTKEKAHMLLTEKLSINQLFKLARVAKELSLLSQDLLLIQLMSNESLGSSNVLSGKVLYTNFVNPEVFRSDASKVFQQIRDLEGNKASTISNAQNSLDDKINTNFLLYLFKRAEDIEFIKYCKENENKNFITHVSVDTKIADAVKPVMAHQNTNEYMSLGNTSLENSNITKQLNILF